MIIFRESSAGAGVSAARRVAINPLKCKLQTAVGLTSRVLHILRAKARARHYNNICFLNYRLAVPSCYYSWYNIIIISCSVNPLSRAHTACRQANELHARRTCQPSAKHL